ncbi:hypothetical protein [Pseudoalteromonas sp. Of11M-6]|uniref:hypothetical protein n=1 Tax=Pseudoalteromonas sp. Of11M-6 TaxID=2917754 RepID=UPI001EF5E17C|nr:hypothetical protein [Pseudoalteromonas sp. Of11M-6]MCG7553286.1 hypothetical protein [Pseudoalteromonas sp. Of11M-6]
MSIDIFYTCVDFLHMKINTTIEVLEKLRVLYDSKTLTELSRKLGKNSSWAAQAKKNDAIPLVECRQACIDFEISMDWLLFDSKGTTLDKASVLEEIQEGLYESKELGILDEISVEQLKATSVLILKRIENLVTIESKDRITLGNAREAK